MAVTIKRKSQNDIALEDVGLGESEPEVTLSEEVVLLEYFKRVEPLPIGSRVQIIALSGPWRYKAKAGDTGKVLKVARSHSAKDLYADDDLYFVKMDHLLGQGKEVLYLVYNELALLESIACQ